MLQDIELFSGLSVSELAEISQITTRISMRRGELIFKQGDLARDLFIIESGQVEISIRDLLQEKKVLTVLKNGDFFGEMALFDKNLIRSATATILQNSVLLIIPGAEFEKLLKKKPTISFKLLGALSRRLRDSNEKIGSTSGDSPRKHAGTVIGVAGPKNGFGKTTFATGISHLLAGETGKKVLFIDLDFYYAEGTFFMGVIGPRNICDLVRKLSAGSLPYPKLQDYFFRHHDFLFTLPAPNELADGELITIPDFINVVKSVKPYFDYVIIDTDGNLSDLFLNVLDVSDHVFFVIDGTSPMNLKSGARYFHGLAKLFAPSQRQSVLLSKVPADFSLEKVAKTFRYRVRGALPRIADSSWEFGKTVYQQEPAGDYCNVLRCLARDILHEEKLQPISPEASSSFLQKLFAEQTALPTTDVSRLTLQDQTPSEGEIDLELSGQNLSVLLNTVRNQLTSGNIDEAKEKIIQALEFCQTSGELFQILGEIFVVEENFSRAIDTFNRSLHLDPGNHLSLGVLSHLNNDSPGFERALKALQDKIQAFPRYPDLRNDLGKLLMRVGQYEHAVVHFRQALEINPGYQDSQINLALALGNLKKNDEAIKELSSIQPKSIRVFYLLGNFLHASGRHFEAFAAYSQIERMNGSFPKLEGKLTKLRTYFRKITGLLEMYQGMLGEHHNYPDLHLKVGSILLTLGRKAEAVERFQEALRLNPNYVDAFRAMQRAQERDSLPLGFLALPAASMKDSSGTDRIEVELQFAEGALSDLAEFPTSFIFAARNLRTNNSFPPLVVLRDRLKGGLCYNCTNGDKIFPDDVLLFSFQENIDQKPFLTISHRLLEAEVFQMKIPLQVKKNNGDTRVVPIRHFLVNLKSQALADIIRESNSMYRTILVLPDTRTEFPGTLCPDHAACINFVLSSVNGDVVKAGDILHVKVMDTNDSEIFDFHFSLSTEEIDNLRKCVVFDPLGPSPDHSETTE